MPAEPRKVLVVEDDPDIRSTLCDLLEAEGYVVQTAKEGFEALVSLRESGAAPCFIVLDLMMPGMNGWTFLRARQQSEELRRIPVAVITADTKAGPSMEGLGVTLHLTKPFDWNRLLAAIERACAVA